jgi:hypothetical protein
VEAESWLDPQARHDLVVTREVSVENLAVIHPLVAA